MTDKRAEVEDRQRLLGIVVVGGMVLIVGGILAAALMVPKVTEPTLEKETHAQGSVAEAEPTEVSVGRSKKLAMGVIREVAPLIEAGDSGLAQAYIAAAESYEGCGIEWGVFAVESTAFDIARQLAEQSYVLTHQKVASPAERYQVVEGARSWKQAVVPVEELLVLVGVKC